MSASSEKGTISVHLVAEALLDQGWLIAPGAVWMALFLAVPILMIVYVSFWTQTTFNISSTPTLAS